jgi:hypothetical protein
MEEIHMCERDNTVLRARSEFSLAQTAVVVTLHHKATHSLSMLCHAYIHIYNSLHIWNGGRVDCVGSRLENEIVAHNIVALVVIVDVEMFFVC